MNNRVKLFIATSLDGYIAREDGDVEWLADAESYGFGEFYESMETLVMGRVTYEQILGGGEYPFAGKKTYVFSRSQAGTTDENAEFVAGGLAMFVSGLRATTEGNIWLVGGAQLVQAFAVQNLIDDYQMFVHPVVLGRGIPLFAPHDAQQALELRQVRRYASGIVQLHYSPTTGEELTADERG